jgi:Zn-dependent M28 family amino/carboxypeptidase
MNNRQDGSKGSRFTSGAALVLALAAAAGMLGGRPGLAQQRERPGADPLLAKLRAAALADTVAYERLSYLCDRIGARPAGSAAYLQAAHWGESVFRQDAQENVRLEPVKVRPWVRGRERLVVSAPFARELPMLGLGGSIGTAGVEAPLVVVSDFSELGPQVNGKIVLYDPPMPADATAGQRYGIYVRFRGRGASEAAAHGAVAALVRSAPLRSLATPHTGAMHYEPDKPRIPAAAITVEDGGWLARLAAQGVEVKLRLEMEAHEGEEVEDANVIAEVRGRSKPDEIVLISGHLDSWDVGQGAQDDGAGVVHVLEAMRLIRALGLAPERTIRAVLFDNEEHGISGGLAYAAAHAQEHHLVAIESDLGADHPDHWGVSGTPQQQAWVLRAAHATGVPVQVGGGGADISPLAEKGVAAVGIFPDPARYFDVHHTRADTLDKVDPAQLREGVAALAVMAWQLANTPQP